MIVSRTPLRISLGGGGTDLPFYANKFGASLVTAAINQYIYISVSPKLEKDIKLLQEENADLNLDALSLQSLGSVKEKLADLGMVVSEENDYLDSGTVAMAR